MNNEDPFDILIISHLVLEYTVQMDHQRNQESKHI